MELYAMLYILFTLAFCLISGIWVGVSLFTVSLTSLYFFTDLPVTKILCAMVWNNTNSSTMLALPLFILMGDILTETKISKQLFEGLTPWVSKIPGGLLHVNVLASALFAAISGSVAATTASVGKITLPELEKRGYDKSLAIGSLASAGTLGIMIPPSMPMLVYGIIANVSIGKLFLAGLIPGITLMLIFAVYIALKDSGYKDRKTDVFTAKDKTASILKILPTIGLITCVLGSIYTGWATPTEAAAIGVGGATVIGIFTRTLNKNIGMNILKSTVRTTSMIMMIMIGASFFSTAMGFLGIPKYICTVIIKYQLSKYLVMAMITAVYLVLGCLIDGFSMIVMTVPIFIPIVTSFGFDPIWYGIYIVLLVQIANITPPVGFNLFLLTGLTKYSIGQIAKWVMPFLFIMIMFVIFITIFPTYITYIPNVLM